jgi:ATP-dependent Clp protease ATP-binding subunit ClpC
MFERYSEPARRVIFYSRYMAHHVGSPEIETEHLLLGLLRADMALSRRFLGSPWAAEEIWQEIERSKPIRAIAPGTVDLLPLSTTAKRVLHLAAEEADQLSSKKIRTEHFLLGLLGDEKCLAAVLLQGHGLGFVSIREELSRNPHDDSATERFVREPSLLPQDVVEVQTRIRSIVSRMEEAIANRDFATARSCSDEERKERDKLYLLCRQHRLSVWLYE